LTGKGNGDGDGPDFVSDSNEDLMGVTLRSCRRRKGVVDLRRPMIEKEYYASFSLLGEEEEEEER
jgi:hypothetical protein